MLHRGHVPLSRLVPFCLGFGFRVSSSQRQFETIRHCCRLSQTANDCSRWELTAWREGARELKPASLACSRIMPRRFETIRDCSRLFQTARDCSRWRLTAWRGGVAGSTPARPASCPPTSPLQPKWLGCEPRLIAASASNAAHT